MPIAPFPSAEVQTVFEAFPQPLKSRLMELRQRIFEVAASDPSIGPLLETLKWGQPGYLTPQTRSGTTLRIGPVKSAAGCYGLFVHCQTRLIADYRELYGNCLTFDGKRCIVFDPEQAPDAGVVDHCIRLALTYHLRKRKEGLPF
ncbi:MAG: DUF1801 domain-containing protein [Rhodospirillales bacterium]|nr:DUF1801 domain-containing protein [Rhodospirillales bacterium]